MLNLDEVARTPKELDVEGERALLARALDRDPQAVNDLVRYLEPKLLVRANSVLSYSGSKGSREEAMDLVQAAWRALIDNNWAALRRWEPERGVKLVAYVGVVASNRMISELRKQRSGPAQVATPPEEITRMAALVDGLEGRIGDRQYLEVVVSELRSRLTAKGQQAFDVLYLEDLSVAEALEKTNLTRESLYSYRRRIKKIVQEIAEQLGQRSLAGEAKATGVEDE